MSELRKIVLRVGCRGGPCCAASDHPGVHLMGVHPVPGDSDAAALRVRPLCDEVAYPRRTRGMEIWLIERLAEIAPLVCSAGGHPVDVPALTLRLAKRALWQ